MRLRSGLQLASLQVILVYGPLIWAQATAGQKTRDQSPGYSADEAGLPDQNVASISAVHQQYFLTICAIFKNEAKGLDEWLQHHILEGVDHFFLVDQGSNDGYMSTIQPYIDEGRVTLMLNPKKHVQLAILENYCFPLHGVTNWMLHIDLDEFMYARQGTIPDYLRQLPNNTAVVHVPWKMYGSSGHREHPQGSVVKNFRMRGSGQSPTGKVVFRPSVAAHMAVHDITVKPGVSVENVYLNVGDTCGTDVLCVQATAHDEALQLNHYAIQSLAFFMQTKMTRGDVNQAASEHVRNLDYFEQYDHASNASVDLDLYYKHQDFFDSV